MAGYLLGAHLFSTFALVVVSYARPLLMKIKWSGLGMTDGSGKIGGNVAAKNRYGNYLRRRGQVINPQTISQQLVRMAFGALSQAWRALDEGQRAAWAALAVFATVFDSFGDAIRLSGAQLFQRFNLNLSSVGLPAISDAPVLIGAAQLGVPAAVFDVGTGDAFTFTVDNFEESVGQDSTLLMEATPPVSAGRSEGSIKNLYRSITVDAVGGNLQTEVLAANTPVARVDATFADGYAANYVSRFGLPVVGQQIFIRCAAVNITTGERSPWIGALVVINDTP